MRLATFAGAMLSAGTLAAWADDAAKAPQLPNHYRGAFVCEVAPGAPDILHVPVDVAVRGPDVQFARPLFNLRGSRVVGSEMGTGAIDAGGNVHLQSMWEFRGLIVHASYDGVLTSGTGALTGKQTWRTREGATGSRACQIVVAPTFDALDAAAD